MKKPFYKKPLFWIILILILFITPSVLKIFQLYVYDYSPEPKPEDFYVRMDNPLFTGIEPALREEVEISKTHDGKIFVDEKKDGYTLVLDPELDVYTRELERGLVYISNKDGCNVVVAKSLDENVMVEFEKDKKEYVSDPWAEVERFKIEQLENNSMEVYIIFYKHKAFDIQHSIWIQGDDGIYSISQSGISYPDCKLFMEVFDGFNFKDI